MLGASADPLAQVLDRENGAEDGTRTRDLLITNQLLYQLSYFGQTAETPGNMPPMGEAASWSRYCSGGRGGRGPGESAGDTPAATAH